MRSLIRRDFEAIAQKMRAVDLDQSYIERDVRTSANPEFEEKL
ncbi:MAG: hypothetical protein ACR2QW_08155 [bacterium]